MVLEMSTKTRLSVGIVQRTHYSWKPYHWVPGRLAPLSDLVAVFNCHVFFHQKLWKKSVSAVTVPVKAFPINYFMVPIGQRYFYLLNWNLDILTILLKIALNWCFLLLYQLVCVGFYFLYYLVLNFPGSFTETVNKVFLTFYNFIYSFLLIKGLSNKLGCHYLVIKSLLAN